MSSRRDYLISLGLAKAGRGKFSNEAKAALEKAIAGGMTFSDNAPTPKAAKPVKSSPKVQTNADASAHGSDSTTEILMPSDLRYYGKRWFATIEGKEVEISERAACTNCQYSLIAHACNIPQALSPKNGIVSVVARG